MRVLLFVQTGDGRPKVRKHFTRKMADPDWREHAAVCAGNADRWWLVECENAEAGRLIILRSQRVGPPDDWTRSVDAQNPTPPGRILASGGKGV